MTAVSSETKQPCFYGLNERKKRVLVLYIEAGGGHRAAAEAIKEMLQHNYEVMLANPLTDLPYIDLFYSLARGKTSGERFYDWMLRNSLHSAVQLYATLGESYLMFNRKRIQNKFTKYLNNLEALPDIIISVIPFFSGGTALASIEKNIPFILLPTDLDVSTFLVGFSDGQLYQNRNFAFALAYDDTELKQKALKRICLSENQVHFTGFPVRSSCLKSYSSEEINEAKELFGLSEDRQNITLVFGANGGKNIASYALEIASMNPTYAGHLEVNVCTGRNIRAKMRLIKKLELQGAVVTSRLAGHATLLLKNGMMMHVRGFVKEFPLLMACSNLIISKTGSCSVNEAIYLKKMLLLDDTPSSSSRKLFWESANVPFVKRHGLGDAFVHSKELNEKILHLLYQQSIGSSNEKSLQLPNFGENLKKLVSQMISREAIYSEQI